MQIRSKSAFLLGALLASLLIGAQLHCCLDLTSQSIDSHFCPVCSAAGTAIVTNPPAVEMAPAVNWLEESGETLVVSFVAPRSMAPRAPPFFR
jgi:hypothetical protein